MTKLTQLNVEKAMRQCDKLTIPVFLKESGKGFDYPKKYWVKSKSRPEREPYPAKAIVAVSLGQLDVNGGYSQAKSACRLLEAIGYEIVGRDGKSIKSGRSVVGPTEKDKIGKIRIGQEKFRGELIKYWKGRCAVTGIKDNGLLRASHIVPWTKSSDFDRMSKWNGLLLSALWDAAFDRGLVSFSDTGAALASRKLSQDARADLNFDGVKPVSLTNHHRKYMQWHRDNILRK